MLEPGIEFTFHSPYDEFRSRVGQRATVLARYTENTPEIDVDEVGPMYLIRFSDGFVVLAWPEEVEDNA